MISVRPTLTVFTPAWNRGSLLPRLFKSIESQEFAPGEVEWLIIDDGSTDNTTELLAEFEITRPDLVRWLRVENGGKHRAINRGATEAQGDWLFLVDSDDAVAPGAIAEILRLLQRYDGDEQVGLLRGLKAFPEEGGAKFAFRRPGIVCHHWQWISWQKAFDSAEVVRRSALRQHPFPEYDGERFMAESWLWHALDRTHQLVCFNREWVNCWYQSTGLTANALNVRLGSLRGTMDVYQAILNSPSAWKIRARAAINSWRYRFHAFSGETGPHERPMCILALVGWLLYRRDRMRVSRTSL